jgi:hypothetical protein
VANGAGPVNADGTFPNVKLNIVRGVPPGAGPWRIADLKADIETNGRIKVRGRGLLLASSNSIGQNAGQSVFATLICEAVAPFVEHSTSFSVPLAADGDFRIDDVLSSVPSTCPSPRAADSQHGRRMVCRRNSQARRRRRSLARQAPLPSNAGIDGACTPFLSYDLAR